MKFQKTEIKVQLRNKKLLGNHFCFAPLVLITFMVGCQSSRNSELSLRNIEGLNSSSTVRFDDKLSKDEQTNNSSQLASISNNYKDSRSKNLQNNLQTNNTLPLPARYSIVEFKEDSDDSLDVVDTAHEFAPQDDPMLTDAPPEFLEDSAFGDNSNPLMCDKSVFYSAWSSQFEQQWLAKNAANYRRSNDRSRALAQARTNEFIRLVYPAIEKTGYDFPVVINSQVLAWIGYFTGIGRKSFVVWLERGKTIIPKMQKTLEQNGLPSDLVYLSMIESGYSTKALSNVGAVGLWQFMPATGRAYGLRINDWLDERRDPVRATQAASQYLTDLYSQFGSWHLAAAGYNGGPGLMSKTLRNYGASSSFFDLTSRNAINSQTANYVPKILAAMIVAKNPALFGFESVKSTAFNQTTSIPVTRSIALSDLAKSIHVNESILQELNPQLRLGITPPASVTHTGKYDLVIPLSKENEALASLESLPSAPTSRLVAARINRREKIAAFAYRYKLTLASLLHANGGLTSSSALRKGQVVYIPVSLGSGLYDKLTSVKTSHHKSSKKYATSSSRRGKLVGLKSKKRKSHHLAYRD